MENGYFYLVMSRMNFIIKLSFCLISAVGASFPVIGYSQEAGNVNEGIVSPSDYIYGYPPTWNPLPGPGTGQQPQYIIVYSSANPRINGVPINPGDWIGVFYKNDNGDTVTGGAGEWSTNGIQFVAFGDNSPGTLPKNGFGYGEVLNWRFYSWSSQKTYRIPSANVSYETCTNCITLNKWYPLSFAKVTNIFTTISFSVSATATPGSICEGSTSQLNAAVSGSYSPYTYSWVSNPSGFTSTIKDPVVNPVQTTQYTVTASDGLLTATGSTTVTVLTFPAVNAGNDATICEGQSRQMNATATGYSSLLWTSSGDGTFSSPSSLNPLYVPGAGDISTGGATLTLTVNFSTPCPGSKADAMILTIQKSPVSNAGPDKSTCDLNTVAITGTALNYNTVQWTTSGSGTFSAPSALTTNYTPGTNDLNNGSVILTLSAIPLSPCTASVSDYLILTLVKSPTADAGSDKNSCGNASVSITGTATGYSSVNWTTSGTGTFTGGNTLTPVYTPSTADVNTGSVTLTLHAIPASPCTVAASDALLLTLTKLPTANAGIDKSGCSTTAVSLTGTASNFNTVQWSTSGTGSFSSSGSLTTNYTPSQADVDLGSVNLTLTASPLSPCTATASDFMVLTLVKLPTCNAGIDKTSCNNTTVSVTGTASGYASVNWTTSGTGTFTGGNTLTPVYTPSTADVNSGSATLTLHASPNSPCTVTVSDAMLLTLVKLPAANAGTDKSGCSTASVSITGTASNNSAVQWTTSGTGTFSVPNSLSTNYTPSQADVDLGSVNLTLTASPLSPCTANASDFMVLTLVKLPTCNAGSDKSVCGTNPAFITGTASNFSTSVWSTSGAGTFANNTSLSTFYFPDAADLVTGSVTLTLSVSPNSPCTSPATDFLLLTLLKSPGITDQPDDQAVESGGDAQFEIVASGAEPLTYEWFGPSGLIPDVNNRVLLLTGVDESDTGSYYCRVTNNCGTFESESAELSVLIQQNLVVPAGWSGISLFVNPADPIIESMFAPVQPNLTILMNSDGMYWPAQQVNTLVNWNNSKGYAVKFSEPVSLQITGLRSQSVITLQTGWNYMPVKSACDVELLPLLANVPQVLYVSDIAGNKVYWPAYGISTLQVLKPGSAYFVKTSQTVNLIFPSCN